MQFPIKNYLKLLYTSHLNDLKEIILCKKQKKNISKMKRKIVLGAICIFRYLNQINYFPQHYTWVAFSYQKFERTSRFFFLSKYFCQNIKKLKTSNPQKKLEEYQRWAPFAYIWVFISNKSFPQRQKGLYFSIKKNLSNFFISKNKKIVHYKKLRK